MVIFHSYVKLPEGIYGFNFHAFSPGKGGISPLRDTWRVNLINKIIGIPICSMYGIFTNICPKNHPNVGKYTIHEAYGI